MKNILILTASPRKNGNTNSLVKEVAAEFSRCGGKYEIVDLYDLDIKPCQACRCCQTDWNQVYCVQEDDMEELFGKVRESDIIVLATPVYSWYCTAPMKAFLDRCVYAFNKYYDDAGQTHQGERGPAIWEGKRLALITTCGYKPEQGMDLLEEGLKRYCKHSQLEYIGSLAERHPTYKRDFMDEDKAAHAKAFADKVLMV